MPTITNRSATPEAASGMRELIRKASLIGNGAQGGSGGLPSHPGGAAVRLILGLKSPLVIQVARQAANKSACACSGSGEVTQ